MYIYNRTSRFQALPFVASLTYANNRIKSGSSYKIKSRRPSHYIQTKPVRVLRPLTKNNIAFLTELGYKVIKTRKNN